MEINSQSPAYSNPQTNILKQESQVRAETSFQPAPPSEAAAPRQAPPDDSQQKAALEESLWQITQRATQNQGVEQGPDELDTYTDQPSQRAVQAAAAYEATQKPESKISVDALI